MKKIIVIFLFLIPYLSFSTIPTKSDPRTISILSILNLRIMMGLGKSWICGGESWMDPMGAQINIESRFLELSNNASLNSGLGLSFQGSSYEEPEFSGKVTLTYLNVPVLFNYDFENGIYGEIGLQPGFLLSAKDKYDGGSNDYKEYVKGFELGLPLGGGYRINNQLEVGIRATIGLTNLSDYESDVKDHNVLVVALFRYQINLFE